MVGKNIFCVDMRFGLVVGVESDCPWEMLRISEPRCASRGQKLWHFFFVQIFLHGSIRWRTDDLEGGKHFVAFNKLAHLLDRLRRIVSIVVLNKIDLASHCIEQCRSSRAKRKTSARTEFFSVRPTAEVVA